VTEAITSKAHMHIRRLVLVTLVAAVALVQPAGRADFRPSIPDQGKVALGLALRQLDVVGTFLQVTAHPDDENNALLAMLKHGQGIRTILATATRGQGGQNEIGPELFRALSVLRTEELASAHRLDGAEQYFARAMDFCYSFSIDETFERWGRREILADHVRLIRMLRPDVIVAMRPDGEGGGQHHQAVARMTGEAFRAAADPSQFPDQIQEGLRPWQAQKLYYTIGYGFSGEQPTAQASRGLAVDVAVYDPLLGRTYAELGSQARSMHKCQGMAQLLALPGPAGARYILGDSTIEGKLETGDQALFDGVDTTLVGLARHAPDGVSQTLADRLAAVVTEVETARRRFSSDNANGTVEPLLRGLALVRRLRANLPAMGLDETAAIEVDHRLETKEGQFEQAVLAAHHIRVDVLADDGLVVPGQPIKATLIVANRGSADVNLHRITFAGFAGDTAQCQPSTVRRNAVFRCEARLAIPSGAVLTEPYWTQLPGTDRYEFDADVPFGVPFRPTPFTVEIDFGGPGSPLTLKAPVQYRYEGDIFSGEKRMSLKVVPGLSVRMTPEIAIIPSTPFSAAASASAARPQAAPAALQREVRVSVVNGGKDAVEGRVSIDLPPGWRASPPGASISLAREDEARTLRFMVTPAPGAQPGEYRVRARVSVDGIEYGRGYQVVEYPHIERRHLYHDAESVLKVIDAQIAPGLTVGYIMGVGDQVPPAIQQLGARVELIDADLLAWGDLSRYDVIMTGVRAYERRDDLRAHNHRLLQFAEAGGTVIVQYNKFEFNQAQYGPYPARVGSQRVTDEQALVELLVPDHQVFNAPNRIDEGAWSGWVQERGLYFLGDRDPRYVDLLQLTEPFEYNKGVKRGALVEARVGSGRWIYVGLGLWRQLPAGTDGAYKLLANLLSLGRHSGPA
jgi:LmbE family N-acetylglucosaminyl deacetylase